MEAKKILIEPVKKNEGKAEKLRVAAYCRVSTDTEDQQTSFEGQVKHYTELIEAKPDGRHHPPEICYGKPPLTQKSEKSIFFFKRAQLLR